MRNGDSVFAGSCNSGEQTWGEAIRPSQFGVIPCSVVLSPLGDSSNRGRSAGTTDILKFSPVSQRRKVHVSDDHVDETDGVRDGGGRSLRRFSKKKISQNETANLENHMEEDPQKSKQKISEKFGRLLGLRKNMELKLMRIRDKEMSKKKSKIVSDENGQTRSSSRVKKITKKNKKLAQKMQLQNRKKPGKSFSDRKRYNLKLSESFLAHRKMIRYLKVRAGKFTTTVSRDRKCKKRPKNYVFNMRTVKKSSMLKVLLALPRNMSYHQQNRFFGNNKTCVNIVSKPKNAVTELANPSINMTRRSQTDKVDRKAEKNKNSFKKFKRNKKHKIQRCKQMNTTNAKSDCRPIVVCDHTEISLPTLNWERNGVKSQSNILNSIKPCYVNLIRSPSAEIRMTAILNDDEKSENTLDGNISPEDKIVKASKTKSDHGKFCEYNLKKCSVNLYRTTGSRSEVISIDADHMNLDDRMPQLDHSDRNEKESSVTMKSVNIENADSHDSSEHTSSTGRTESPTIARNKSKQKLGEKETWHDGVAADTESDFNDSINCTSISTMLQKNLSVATRDSKINLKSCSVRLTAINAKSPSTLKCKQEPKKSNNSDNLDKGLQNEASQNEASQNEASQNKILTPKLLVSDMAFSSDEESDDEVGRNDSLIAIDNLLVSLQDNEAANSGSDQDSPTSEMDASPNLSSGFNSSWMTTCKSRDSVNKEIDEDDKHMFKDVSDSESSDIIVVHNNCDQSLKTTTYDTDLPTIKRQKKLRTWKLPTRGHQNVFLCNDAEHTDRYGIKPCVVRLEKINNPAV